MTSLGDRFRGGLDYWNGRVDDSFDGLDKAPGTLQTLESNGCNRRLSRCRFTSYWARPVQLDWTYPCGSITRSNSCNDSIGIHLFETSRDGARRSSSDRWDCPDNKPSVVALCPIGTNSSDNFGPDSLVLYPRSRSIWNGRRILFLFQERRTSLADRLVDNTPDRSGS